MSYCTDCIHYKVCGNEGVDDSAMTFCVDKQTAEKTAEWIDSKDVIEITQEIQHHYMCSKCGMYFDRMTKYCPNCGRRMLGEQTE